ncbi:MAG: TolC family protein [Gemmatimonadaceae bacterium]|jgi:outer membrane protein TolC|nr:TolC family protein [Gemmatimonadaceae bacterium]
MPPRVLPSALFALLPAALLAQPGAPPPPLRLADALARAERLAVANRGARSAADAQRAAALTALRGVLPTARVDAGYLRTTDPIGVFGTTLRQRQVTPANFDPARLNFPGATPNYTGALSIEQPIVNVDAWAGRRSAQHATRASDANADWTRVGIHVDVIAAWYGATLANEKARTLESALRAARAHVQQAEAMARNGIVTPSDAMLAAVKAGEVEAALIEARGDATTARLALATVIGTPGDTNFALPDALPPRARIDALLDAPAIVARTETRADLRAAQAMRNAADADVQRTRATYLPRLNGFARYDWNSALRPFGGASNWTVGVMASWVPVAGLADWGETRAAAARRAGAQAMHDGAIARAQLEIARATTAVAVARARSDIAERAVAQATDAHRIIGRKYAGGLAAVSELLTAAATETQVRLGAAAARHALIIAAAEHARAIGNDPARLAPLDAVADVALRADTLSH